MVKGKWFPFLLLLISLTLGADKTVSRHFTECHLECTMIRLKRHLSEKEKKLNIGSVHNVSNVAH